MNLKVELVRWDEHVIKKDMIWYGLIWCQGQDKRIKCWSKEFWTSIHPSTGFIEIDRESKQSSSIKSANSLALSFFPILLRNAPRSFRPSFRRKHFAAHLILSTFCSIFLFYSLYILSSCSSTMNVILGCICILCWIDCVPYNSLLVMIGLIDWCRPILK